MGIGVSASNRHDRSGACFDLLFPSSKLVKGPSIE
jgi:hypothetical protein